MTHRYRANYERIARDHVRYWRETGENPFQGESIRRHNEMETLDLIRRHVKPADRILDAGCGIGDLLLELDEYDTVGIDISAVYAEVARERGLDVQAGRIEKLPWPRETFEMVICTDVLEHVLDLNRAVRELLRVLKPGGILIVRTPNQEDLSLNADYEYVHLRRFDYSTHQLLFRKIFGCEILETIERAEVINVAVRKP